MEYYQQEHIKVISCEHQAVSNEWQLDSLFNIFFRQSTNKTSKLCNLEDNSSVTSPDTEKVMKRSPHYDAIMELLIYIANELIVA